MEFSPFYNAVIGSRGSGKSTLIESIRLAMRKTEGLTAAQRQNLNRFSESGMTTDSFIECVFRKEGTDLGGGGINKVVLYVKQLWLIRHPAVHSCFTHCLHRHTWYVRK